jgi:hypothetical protein
MAHRSRAQIPSDFRPPLEAARLDLLVLFRALGRMHRSAAEIPQRLIRQLFELDAGFVEALWALDQPPGNLDLTAMLRDALAALEQLPKPAPASRNIFHHAPFPPLASWKRHFGARRNHQWF